MPARHPRSFIVHVGVSTIDAVSPDRRSAGAFAPPSSIAGLEALGDDRHWSVSYSPSISPISRHFDCRHAGNGVYSCLFVYFGTLFYYSYYFLRVDCAPQASSPTQAQLQNRCVLAGACRRLRTAALRFLLPPGYLPRWTLLDEGGKDFGLDGWMDGQTAQRNTGGCSPEF